MPLIMGRANKSTKESRSGITWVMLMLAASITFPVLAANKVSTNGSFNKGSNENSAANTAEFKGLAVNDAYIRAPIPGQSVTVGYLWLCNFSESDELLVDVRSPQAEKVEIHTHLHENGMMKMRKLNELALGAGEHHAFKPHGLHLMVFNLQSKIETVELVFTFASGRSVTAQAKVKSLL